MTRWLLAPEAADNLDRLTEFLQETAPNMAVETVDLILDALGVLARHPRMGRPVRSGLRELVISCGRTGYLALYSHDEQADIALVLAIRHQREQDYH
ncbi:MAG: type II toxin-antitoxin system RelE/ParE family toxin [Rhodocyclaceae bacterium]|nr:type II toxin-antitoxin system RelE/ParE family toxin [Rhodocyclaceae bacterium]